LSLSSQTYGFGIRDPEKTFPDPGSRGQKGTGSWIQGSKRHRIPDPDPQHCLGKIPPATGMILSKEQFADKTRSVTILETTNFTRRNHALKSLTARETQNPLKWGKYPQTKSIKTTSIIQ
jgi:hypothetical protein